MTIKTKSHPAAKWAAEYLRRAAVFLRKNGWTQGFLYRDRAGDSAGWWQPGHRACAEGALTCAYVTAPDSAEGHRLARAAIRWVLETEHDWDDSLPAWNDHPSRTADEVVAMLEKAAGLIDSAVGKGTP